MARLPGFAGRAAHARLNDAAERRGWKGRPHGGAAATGRMPLPHGHLKLYGPEKAMLGMEAVRELLGGITSRQVRALIAAGHFPRPIRAGGKGPPHWSGLTIAAWQHLSPMLAVGEVEIGEDDE